MSIEARCDICGESAYPIDVWYERWKAHNWVVCGKHEEEFLKKTYDVLYAMRSDYQSKKIEAK